MSCDVREWFVTVANLFLDVEVGVACRLQTIHPGKTGGGGGGGGCKLVIAKLLNCQENANF